MPRGIESIREAAAEIESRRQGGGGGWVQWFRVEDGGEAVVRFLEQDEDVAWSWTHQLAPRDGQNFGDDEVCLNQDGSDRDACPGCQQGMRRKFIGYINLIWREGPVWKRNDEGRLVKENGRLVLDRREDILAVWKGGIMVFDELTGLNATYKGLMTRDFRLRRRGDGLNTSWQIYPADPDGGPKAMSAADKKLAAEKTDLTPLITPPSYESWGQGGNPLALVSGGGDSAPEGADINPFRKKRGE